MVDSKEKTCGIRGMCSHLRAGTCILKSLILESMNSGKCYPVCTSWRKFHRDAHTSQSSGVLRSTRILTLDQLPAPGPWTASFLRLTSTSHHTVNSTKPLLLFHSPTETVTEARHILVSMESRSTTWRWLSWFLSNMILLPSHSYSLSHLISPGH